MDFRRHWIWASQNRSMTLPHLHPFVNQCSLLQSIFFVLEYNEECRYSSAYTKGVQLHGSRDYDSVCDMWNVAQDIVRSMNNNSLLVQPVQLCSACVVYSNILLTTSHTMEILLCVAVKWKVLSGAQHLVSPGACCWCSAMGVAMIP